MIPNKKLLKEITNNMLMFAEVIEYRLLYKANQSKINDIDVFFIIKDQSSYTTVIQQFSKLAIPYVKDTGIYLSCFPLSISYFEKPNSQFLKNVKLNGKTI